MVAQGLNASNIDASSASDDSRDQLVVINSNLLSEPDDCVGGNHGIYSNGSSSYLGDVNIEVRVKTQCESHGGMSAVDLGSEGRAIEIERANISISAESAFVSGITSFNAPVYLNDSKINAQSRDNQAFGIIVASNQNAVIEFIGGSSYLYIFAPEVSPFYSYDAFIEVRNNSNPPSICTINGESDTCKLP